MDYFSLVGQDYNPFILRVSRVTGEVSYGPLPPFFGDNDTFYVFLEEFNNYIVLLGYRYNSTILTIYDQYSGDMAIQRIFNGSYRIIPPTKYGDRFYMVIFNVGGDEVIFL